MDDRHRLLGFPEWVEGWISTFFGTLLGALVVGVPAVCWPYWVSACHDPFSAIMFSALLVAAAIGELCFVACAWVAAIKTDLPFGPAVAMRQPRIPVLLRPAVAAWWVAHFVGGTALAYSTRHMLPPGSAPFVAAFLTFCWGAMANTHAMLAIGTFTKDSRVLANAWSWRTRWDILSGILTGLLSWLGT